MLALNTEFAFAKDGLHTGNVATDGTDSRRALKLADGAEFTEQLEKFDGEAKTYTYSIVASPLPLADYRSTITVRREGEKSTIEWTTTFKPLDVGDSELGKALESFYQAGFDNLRKLMGSSGT